MFWLVFEKKKLVLICEYSILLKWIFVFIRRIGVYIVFINIVIIYIIDNE